MGSNTSKISPLTEDITKATYINMSYPLVDCCRSPDHRFHAITGIAMCKNCRGKYQLIFSCLYDCEQCNKTNEAVKDFSLIIGNDMESVHCPTCNIIGECRNIIEVKKL